MSASRAPAERPRAKSPASRPRSPARSPPSVACPERLRAVSRCPYSPLTDEPPAEPELLGGVQVVVMVTESSDSLETEGLVLVTLVKDSNRFDAVIAPAAPSATGTHE